MWCSPASAILCHPPKHPSWQYRGQPWQREWHPIRLAAESAGVSVTHPRRPGRTIVCSFVASGLGLPRIGLASRRAKTCFYFVWAPPRRPPCPVPRAPSPVPRPRPLWEKDQIRGLLLRGTLCPDPDRELGAAVPVPASWRITARDLPPPAAREGASLRQTCCSEIDVHQHVK